MVLRKLIQAYTPNVRDDQQEALMRPNIPIDPHQPVVRLNIKKVLPKEIQIEEDRFLDNSIPTHSKNILRSLLH
ncbi:hypothetical protein KA013_05175 [Patescibacteria group bacterium]|nr:hypothetical protein [Patescibacteria group bacterium]